MLAQGRDFRFPRCRDALERIAAEGAEPFYRGESAQTVAEWVRERGGTLGPTTSRAYEAIEREPIRVRFRGTEVLTNPPPSSGGILIAYALGLLERLGERSDLEQLVAAMEAANASGPTSAPRGCTTELRHSLCLEALGRPSRRAGDGSAPRPTSPRSTRTGCAPR